MVTVARPQWPMARFFAAGSRSLNHGAIEKHLSEGYLSKMRIAVEAERDLTTFYSAAKKLLYEMNYYNPPTSQEASFIPVREPCLPNIWKLMVML